MPEYDYRCRKCGKGFTVTETMSQHWSKRHRCPSCDSAAVEQVPSRISVKTSKKS